MLCVIWCLSCTPQTQTEAGPFVPAIQESLALCPGLSHAALEPVLKLGFLQPRQNPAAWQAAVERLLALASQQPQRLAGRRRRLWCSVVWCN